MFYSVFVWEEKREREKGSREKRRGNPIRRSPPLYFVCVCACMRACACNVCVYRLNRKQFVLVKFSISVSNVLRGNSICTTLGVFVLSSSVFHSIGTAPQILEGQTPTPYMGTPPNFSLPIIIIFFFISNFFFIFLLRNSTKGTMSESTERK